MDWLQVCTLCACLAARVFATPPPGYVKQPETDQHPPKYEFGYDVKDGYGGSQGHLETRDGEFALGKYYVSLPSNQQKVDYFADDWGFHPLVEYKTSSGSSSMSTQFALGEKAVAALSRQYGVAPPLEILKTKVAQSLVAGTGPQVSIQGSSGVIPGPSDEPVHNSLEGETFSQSTTTPGPPTVQLSVTPSSVPHESTLSVNVQQVAQQVELSTETPTTHVTQTLVQSTTENYPVSGTGNEGVYQGGFESQKQSSFSQSASVGSTGFSTESYPVSGNGNEGAYRGGFESQRQNSNYQSSSLVSTGHTLTAPSVLRQYTPSTAVADYHTVSGPAVSPAQFLFNQGGQSSSFSSSQNGQVTSYLADSNAAVDVTNNGLAQRLPAVSEYSPNTRISAVLVGEGETHYEENEIRNDYNRYVSSTTQTPPKTVFKPIVVSETGGVDSTLAIFSSQGLSSTERTHSTTVGKLYHREGRLKSHRGFSTTESSTRGQEYFSTPAPTPEPVLVTPRLEASLLTSSGNILAPIQAGVSISTHEHQEEDCDEQVVIGDSKESAPSSGPDIEKQVLREEAVYKTTVDIQKSIPFEIHPDEDNHQTSQGAEEQYSQSSQGEYNEAAREEYRSSNPVEYNQVSSEGYNQNSQVTHQSTSQEEYKQNANTEFQTPPQAYPQYHAPEVATRPGDYASELNANQVHPNNFLQQVVYAYHKMANNHNSQIDASNGGYAINYPVVRQPLFVPNRLYYVYLQRYNPYVNRYGSQSQLYTNYRPPVTTPPPTPTESQTYDHNEGLLQDSISHPAAQVGQTYSQQEYQRGSYNANGNAGYAAFINHEGTRPNGPYESQSVTNTNINNLYDHSGNEHQAGESRPASQAVSSEEGQRVSEGIRISFEQSNRDEAIRANSEAERIEAAQQTAQEYAAQLNNALSSESNVAPAAPVPHESQHIQFSTGQGQDSRALLQESLHEEELVREQNPQEKYIDESTNDVLQSNNILHRDVPVPQYVERTKLVEIERPIHIHHPVPVEYTKIVEKPVPVAHPVPVHHTQFVEKPVPVPQPVPVEVTRVVDRPVPVPHPVPVAYTKVVAVEKPVAVPHPVPYAVTKLVAVDRPIAYPQPVPVPYAVPHPVSVPVPQLIPYPHVVPVPVKDYRPVYVYRKATGGRLLHREAHQTKQPAFRPSQPVFTSQYPPQTYHVTGYLTGPQAKNRGHGRKLCIEYGGFKPPLIPSVQIPDDPKPSYGPPTEEKH